MPESRRASTSASVEVGAVVDRGQAELGGEQDARARAELAGVQPCPRRPYAAPAASTARAWSTSKAPSSQNASTQRAYGAAASSIGPVTSVDVAGRVVGVLGRHDVRAQERGLVGELPGHRQAARLVVDGEAVAGLDLDGGGALAASSPATSRATWAVSCSSVAARVAATVVRMPPAAYGLPGHPGRELLRAVAGEDQVAVAVHEAGQHRPAARVDHLVGGGRLGGRADPGDPAALDDQRRVGPSAPSRSRSALGVVGDELADVGDQRRGHSAPIASSSSRPISSSSPACRRPGRSATTWTTSAAVAANTAVCSSAPVPAVRGLAVSRVTRSARWPTAMARRREASVRAGRRVEQLGGGPVAALLGGQPLVHLEAAHLLERVDHRVAVAAERDPAAGVVPAAAAGTDAVGEVALGGRRDADVGAGGAEQLDVVVGQVRRVHDRGVRAEQVGLVQQPGRGDAVRREAGLVLARPARTGGRAAAPGPGRRAAARAAPPAPSGSPPGPSPARAAQRLGVAVAE